MEKLKKVFQADIGIYSGFYQMEEEKVAGEKARQLRVSAIYELYRGKAKEKAPLPKIADNERVSLFGWKKVRIGISSLNQVNDEVQKVEFFASPSSMVLICQAAQTGKLSRLFNGEKEVKMAGMSNGAQRYLHIRERKGGEKEMPALEMQIDNMTKKGHKRAGFILSGRRLYEFCYELTRSVKDIEERFSKEVYKQLREAYEEN